MLPVALALLLSCARVAWAQCRPYASYVHEYHEPYSEGKYNLSYARPIPYCRTFVVDEVEHAIRRMKGVIADPELFRLFENCFPNTLDTTVAWRGYANGSDEELSFIITGDINAMWLRDSANQLLSYRPLLQSNSNIDSLAGLYRGAINLQARYILEAPYCNAFQAPPEAPGQEHHNNLGTDQVFPTYDVMKVFSCDYELDSLGSFLQLSSNYAEATGDYSFFQRHSWVKAVEAVMDLAHDMMTPTYGENGTVLQSPYTFTVLNRFGGSPINGGKGNPVKRGTGLIRSFFRPSDDACIFQLFIPGNMMFSRFLRSSASIMLRIQNQSALAQRMLDLADTVHAGIQKYGIVHHPDYGRVYAYEVDGYGGANVMDDANVPSLLSAPFLGYLDRDDKVYQNTRKKILSDDNPYWAWGPVMSATGGPHSGPGRAWPMSNIMRILTSDDDAEITEMLKGLLSTTNGFGLIHESISAQMENVWTRPWFAWANGLFGQMILELAEKRPHILKKSFQ